MTPTRSVGLVKLVQHWVVSEEVLAGTKIPGGGERGRLYITLHCHHQNDSRIKMGSDVSHFHVSLIVRNKVTWHCPQTTTFEERGQMKQNWTEVLCLPAQLAHWPARLVLQMTFLVYQTESLQAQHISYNWCLWWAHWFLKNPLYSVFGNASSKQVTKHFVCHLPNDIQVCLVIQRS